MPQAQHYTVLICYRYYYQLKELSSTSVESSSSSLITHAYSALTANTMPTIKKNKTPFQLSKLNTIPRAPKITVNAMLTTGVNKHTATIRMIRVLRLRLLNQLINEDMAPPKRHDYAVWIVIPP